MLLLLVKLLSWDNTLVRTVYFVSCAVPVSAVVAAVDDVSVKLSSSSDKSVGSDGEEYDADDVSDDSLLSEFNDS